MIDYNNCTSIFEELGFEVTNTHFYSTGFASKTYMKDDICIMFYQDDLSKDSEFIISKGERDVVYVGRLSSEEFVKELLKNLDYELIV